MRPLTLLLLAFLSTGCSKARQAADRASVAEQAAEIASTAVATERLTKIGVAIHAHNDALGYLPVGVMTTDNRLGLSWRVELLPYLGETALYKQFKREEPWDSTHNKALLDKMPAVFATPGVPDPAGHTHVRAFVAVAGPHRAMLPGPAELNPKYVRPAGSPVTLRQLSHFWDGITNSFMLVEAAEAVPWTKPEGLELHPDKPLPKLGVTPGGFLAMTGSGSVRLIPDTLPESSLRIGITIDDTQMNPPDLMEAIWGKTGQ